MDLPATLRLARPFFENFSGRVEFQPGDYRRATLGNNAFDVVLMSHVTHDESETTNLSLFRRAHRALKPGGVLAIHDFVVDESHTSSVFSALFSVHMLTYTNQGKVYSLDDYKKGLRTAGFDVKRTVPINRGQTNESCLLVALKKGRAPLE